MKARLAPKEGLMRTWWIGFALAATGVASAGDLPRGAYLCTVEQKAGIGAEVQEGAAPPAAFIDKAAAKFRIVATPPTKKTKGRVSEAARSVLTEPYSGDGWKFSAKGEQAFLRLDFIGEAGWLWFYHAGFEKPDIDHLNLSVRSGPCEPAK
jgi:hypothetical protein